MPSYLVYTIPKNIGQQISLSNKSKIIKQFTSSKKTNLFVTLIWIQNTNKYSAIMKQIFTNFKSDLF